MFRKRRTSFTSESFPAAVCRALTDDFTIDGGEYWSHVLHACELAKTTKDPALISEGIRQLRKRIQSPNHLLVMKGLLLVESLVKNCSSTQYVLSTTPRRHAATPPHFSGFVLCLLTSFLCFP